MPKQIYKVVGLMSGTSLDGIDVVYVEFKRDTTWQFQMHNSVTLPYTSEWIDILSTLTQVSDKELQRIDTAYSKYLANRVKEYLVTAQINAVDFVASHGHTALHKPELGYTYQIGNQQVFANLLGQKVICDFRVQDVALGGQGAPLVPIGDCLLFSEYTYCINLGGFANISFQHKGKRMAYDICPVNIVLNHYARQLGFDYDNDGKIARQGVVHQSLLHALNSLPYYTMAPPKSLGLEWVEAYVLPMIDTYTCSIPDILRTVTEHVAIQISNILQGDNTSVLVTGGGAYNAFLMQRIQALTTSKIVIPPKAIIEFKEAIIFGLLGVLKAQGAVNVLASVTGAKQDHSSGRILFPEN